MQRGPVQSTEERMAPEVTEAFRPQTDLPLTDEPGDEGASLFGNLRARGRELKILLRIKRKKERKSFKSLDFTLLLILLAVPL